MPWFLEMQFADGRWQRNPTPFATRREAELEGFKTTADNAPDPKMLAELTELRIPHFEGYTGPKYRVVKG